MDVWNWEAALKVPRYRHACGVLKYGNKRIVIAAGGIDNFGHSENSVETMEVTEEPVSIFHFAQQWEYGPSMPMILKDGASATSSGGKAVFITGGTSLDGTSTSVLKFYCIDGPVLQCSWTKVDYELPVPSAKGLALMIPQLPMALKGYPNARHCPEGNKKTFIHKLEGH